MESKGKIICRVVAILGLISAGTGIGAEVTRVKASQVPVDSFRQCSYPESLALGLALTAAASLVIAQIIIIFSTNSFCCKRACQIPNSNWARSRIFFGLSWITFVIAVVLFLRGAALNDQHGKATERYGHNNCYVFKPGFFVVGAFLAAVSAILGILCYQTLYSLGKNTTGIGFSSNTAVPNQGGITMAQPYFLPQGNATASNQGGIAMA